MADWAIIEIAKGAIQEVSLAQAAEITGLGEDEILWAIEEEGHCETDTHIVVDAVDAPEVIETLS